LAVRPLVIVLGGEPAEQARGWRIGHARGHSGLRFG
jgi:hypothetical protein